MYVSLVIVADHCNFLGPIFVDIFDVQIFKWYLDSFAHLIENHEVCGMYIKRAQGFKEKGWGISKEKGSKMI